MDHSLQVPMIPLLLLLPHLTHSYRCSLSYCRGSGSQSNHVVTCFNTTCGLNGTLPTCTSISDTQPGYRHTSPGNQTTFKECEYGCELGEQGGLVCVERFHRNLKVHKDRLLIVILAISLSGLTLVGCLTHWYLKKNKVATDVIVQNANLRLIELDTDKDEQQI